MRHASEAATATEGEPAFERAAVAAVATTTPALLLVHALAAALHAAPGISPGAASVSFALVAVGLAHALVQWRVPRLSSWGWAVTPAAAALLLAAIADSPTGGVAVAVCGALQGWSQSRIAHQLPSTIDGALHSRTIKAVGWALLALLAIVQTGRLATHQADPTADWWVTSRNPSWTQHQCFACYVHAVGLAERAAENLYDDAHYVASSKPGAGVQTAVENLAPHVECPYTYPPPFLLLPWAAFQLTNDYLVMRPLWFALHGLGFFAIVVATALWVGGARGRMTLWLLPAVWVAVPTLQAFQYGQFHLSAIALAMAGMLAFEYRRPQLGGALLAAGIVSKLYPAVLLPLFIFQRRWYELITTLAWVVGFGLLTVLVFGLAPYQAFFSFQASRLLDGMAFQFVDDQAATLAIQLGVATLPQRLAIAGLEVLPASLGPWIGRFFTLVLIGLIWRARHRVTSRAHTAMLWLALLNLAVLQGPAPFVDYTLGTSLWLLAFVAVDMSRSRLLTAGLWPSWLLLMTIVGTFPIPDDVTREWPSVIDSGQVAISTLVMTLLVYPLNFWCAVRRPEGAPGDVAY